jgi:hypothetical protein
VRLTQPQVVRASSGGMGGTALAEVATSTRPGPKTFARRRATLLRGAHGPASLGGPTFGFPGIFQQIDRLTKRIVIVKFVGTLWEQPALKGELLVFVVERC